MSNPDKTPELFKAALLRPLVPRDRCELSTPTQGRCTPARRVCKPTIYMSPWASGRSSAPSSADNVRGRITVAKTRRWRLGTPCRESTSANGLLCFCSLVQCPYRG